MAKFVLVRRGLCVLIVFSSLSIPAFTQVRTTPVEVRNEPVVKLDPTNNTVNAQQSGTWSVGIDSSANLVSERPRHYVGRLWDSDRVVAPGPSILLSVAVCLDNYREVRAVIKTTQPVGTPSQLRVWIRLYSLDYPHPYLDVGYVTFGQPNEPFVKSATNYYQQSSVCMLSFPVWGRYVAFYVQNLTPDTVTISSSSYVYLIN